MVGVLHTWTRALVYHPHVHYIVTGGGLDRDGFWHPSRENYLVAVEALSVLFKAKVRDYLKKAGLFDEVPCEVWKKDWVVHSEAVGKRESAMKYLAPYIFRVAISNNRILKLEDGKVTFQYKESATEQVKTCTLSAEEFIRRFLQHVLPERFVKVRYYGLMSPGNRELLLETSELLLAIRNEATGREVKRVEGERDEAIRCPGCGKQMKLIEKLKPKSREPP